jgi:hypothetical protein
MVVKLLKVLGLVAFAAVAVERFYEHPTRGRGLQALLAALQAGEAL